MGKITKATCVVCGKEYDVCLSCKDQNKIKPWRSIADSAECYKIFLVLTQYNNGYVTKEEAKKQLETITFNKKDFKESVQEKINEIMGTTSTSQITSTKKSTKSTTVETENK